MARLHEIAVPDVGDKGALSVAEILVRPGDAVWADDALITVESGKAALDVPAPVITLSLQMRFASRDEKNYTARMLSALRNQFGGHAIKKSE